MQEQDAKSQKLTCWCKTAEEKNGNYKLEIMKSHCQVMSIAVWVFVARLLMCNLTAEECALYSTFTSFQLQRTFDLTEHCATRAQLKQFGEYTSNTMDAEKSQMEIKILDSVEWLGGGEMNNNERVGAQYIYSLSMLKIDFRSKCYEQNQRTFKSYI